jgi:hypothetical protein
LTTLAGHIVHTRDLKFQVSCHPTGSTNLWNVVNL